MKKNWGSKISLDCPLSVSLNGPRILSQKKLVVLFGSTSLRNSFSHRLFLLLQFGGLIFEEKNWVIKLPPNCLRLNQNIAHLSCVFAHCKALKIVSFYSTLSQTLNFAPAFLAPPPPSLSLKLWIVGSFGACCVHKKVWHISRNSTVCTKLMTLTQSYTIGGGGGDVFFDF